MRLKDSEIAAIRSTIQDLDKDAQIYLFGSRVDDGKKGGDIDLLVMSARLAREDKRAIRMRLYELIGEQKIDIVIAGDDADPFVKLALETGVRL
jgi:predicted nucleotidyltransferase